MKTKKASYFKISIVILFSAIIPLLIRVTLVDYPMTQYTWYENITQYVDIYSYFKSHVIIAVGLAALISLATRYFKDKAFPPLDGVVIATLVFAGAIIVSQVFSVDPQVSRFGFIGRFEGYLVWLSYLSVFLYIYLNDWIEKEKLLVIKWFLASNFLLSIIGIAQYFGFDPLINTITKPFISSFNMMNVDYIAEYTINYQVIVQSLYHFNYVAFYISLSFPIVLTLLLYSKNNTHKIALGALSLLILFNLLGSTSRGGLLGILIAMPFFIFLNRKHIFKNRYLGIGFLVLIILAAGGFEFATDGFMTKRIKSTFTTVSAPWNLKNIDVNENSVTFYIDDDVLDITLLYSTEGSLSIKSMLNNEYVIPSLSPTDNTFYFDEASLKDFKVFTMIYNNQYILGVQYKNEVWPFGYDQGTLSYLNPFGNFVKIDKPERIGFDGRERLGSSRGYIWSRTIPLILSKPVTGYGPDNFVIAFPQDDYIGKFNAYNTSNMIVDKPHNTLLHIAINSGVIALICYLLLHVYYFKNAFKSITKSNFAFNGVEESLYFIAIVSYFIASLFNDSTVHVSPVFWTLLAFALQHHRNRKKAK